MAGELQLGGSTVATHTGSGASAVVTIDNGVKFPAGHIIQIQRGSRDLHGIVISSATYVDTVTKAITTVGANSTILIFYDGQVWINGPSNMYTYILLNRTGGTSGDGDIVPASAVRQLSAQSVTANSVHTMEQTYTHIDSPAVAAGTTITYKIKQNGSSAGEASIVGSNCSLVLFEIAA